MAKPEWGTKRTCLSCGARFYDLRKRPITCPKCDGEFSAEDFVAKRRPRPVPVETKPVEKSTPLVEAAEEEDVVDSEEEDLDEDLAEIEDEDDEVIEDTSDLGEDDDDMAEVLEHTEEGDKD